MGIASHASEPRDVVSTVLGFARTLRAAGVTASPDRVEAMLSAVSVLGVLDATAVYWAGRLTLCAGLDDLDRYDAAFAAYFGGEAPRRSTATSASPPPRVSSTAPLEQGRGAGEEGEDPSDLAVAASGDEVLRHRDVADLTPTERALLAQLFATIRPRAPRRSAVRRRPHHRGALDVRRTLRDELRRGGEPGRLRYRRPVSRPRRVVLLVDVSGSMEPYADALLRLAHVWVRSAPRTTEVFTVGTRLTRVTRALRDRDPDVALRGAGEQVPDWSGGTRLGEVLQAFLDRWGRRGTARGAVVVVLSDGWERGEPALLAEQMARLRRLAHRVIWVNPHRGKAGYRPVQGGIVAALPHVDHFVAGHSLATFTELMEVVARA